jgi:transcriptional regulator with XRE-family HTH domain
MSDFGLILRAILHRKNFSQRAAATALGMDQSTISYYCRVKKPPRPHVLAHMAAGLGVSEAELLGQAFVRVAETAAAYQVDRRGIWMDRLRVEYQKNPDRVATFARAAWPKAMAEEIIAWLAAKK